MLKEEESKLEPLVRKELPIVRVGDWVKTDEDSWVSLSAISEVCLEYQGSETKEEDYYNVQLILKTADLWLPNSDDREVAMKHGNFYNQMSDPQRRDIYLGTKEECEQIVKQIIR